MEAGFGKVVAVDDIIVPATKSDREKNDRRVEISTISSLRCSSLVVGGVGGDEGVWNATVPSSSGETNNTSNHLILLDGDFFLEKTGSTMLITII